MGLGLKLNIIATVSMFIPFFFMIDHIISNRHFMILEECFDLLIGQENFSID